MLSLWKQTHTHTEKKNNKKFLLTISTGIAEQYRADDATFIKQNSSLSRTLNEDN